MANGVRAARKNAELAQGLRENRGQVAGEPMVPKTAHRAIEAGAKQRQKAVTHEIVETGAADGVGADFCEPGAAPPRRGAVPARQHGPENRRRADLP